MALRSAPVLITPTTLHTYLASKGVKLGDNAKFEVDRVFEKLQ